MATLTRISSYGANVILESQLRESFGRVVYAHKTHEKAADILMARLTRLRTSQIILCAVSATSFVSVLFGQGSLGSFVGAACSTILLALILYTRSFDLSSDAQQHRQVANRIWGCREKYLSLITDLAMDARSLESMLRMRDCLVNDLQTIYSDAPSTTHRAYRKARKALKIREEMSFSTAEIDSLLPEPLRRASESDLARGKKED